MTQLALPLETPIAGRSRRDDPASSRAAGRQVNATAERQQIRTQLAAHSEGLTADELVVVHNGIRVHRSQVASRLSQMKRLGDVETWSYRVNERGNSCQVWTLVPRWVRMVDVETNGRL